MHSLVSIIMPCYNADKFIVEAIESVIAQSYANWELIVVNDASTDKSQTYINMYVQKDSRIIHIQNNTNTGVANSRNIALNTAQGTYIAFLDADDMWLPQKLEQQVTLMQKENIAMCYSAYHTIDTNGEKRSTFRVPAQVNYADMLKTSYIGTLTTMYNAKVLGKVYLSDMGHEDYVMKLAILKRIPYAKGINIPLAKYRVQENSLSSNKLKAALWQWRIYREVEKLSFCKSCYYFVQYAYCGVRKYR